MGEPWRLEARPADPGKPTLALFRVLVCQDAWRRLTRKSRAALVAVAEHSAVPHPASVKALQAHGLLDEHGAITVAGTAVVRHRPDWSAS